MWDWFTINSIWFLTGASVFFIALVISRNMFRDSVAKLKPDKRDTKKNKFCDKFLLSVIYISVAIIMLSFIAIILSSDDVFSSITIESIQEWLLEHGVVILAYIAIAYFIYRISRAFVPKMVTGLVKSSGKGRHSKSWFERRAKTLTGLIIWIIAIVTGAIAFFLILGELGMDITPMLASAGVVGIALALGHRLSLRTPGRHFYIDGGPVQQGRCGKIAGISGEVEEVNLRRTVLRDLDGIVHTIPNSTITTASNYTRDLSRVNLDIPVAYGEDLDRVFEVINRVGKDLAADAYFGKLIKTPPRVLRVQKFADSAIEIRILGDVQPSMQWEVTGELRKRLKKAFDEEESKYPPHIKVLRGDEKKEDSVICKELLVCQPSGNKFCEAAGRSCKNSLTLNVNRTILPTV